MTLKRTLERAAESPHRADTLTVSHEAFLYPFYAYEPDDTPLPIDHSRLWHASTSSATRFADILRTALQVCGVTDQDLREKGFDSVESYVQTQANHEQKHASVAKALGLKDIRYGVAIFGETDIASNTERRLVLPSIGAVGVMPKIGHAVLMVFPDDPSEGDLHTIQALGYSSADKVWEHVRTYNEQHPDRPMPIRAER